MFNANTELVRIRNVDAANFGRITQNLSPRIVRFGARLNFCRPSGLGPRVWFVEPQEVPMMLRRCLSIAALGVTPALNAQVPDGAALQHSIEQLRHSIGRWSVVTEFLKEDGSVARSAAGSYEFSWVVPDRVVSGKSEIPELKRASGILFYIREARREIEMVSVGADGMLWTMTGPLGGEERTSQQYKTDTGGAGRLRFTRSNVSQDSFESRMEYSEDGGRTWKPGNRQRFTRAPGPAR